MKILEIYKNLITEVEVESCVKKFGHELFGHELGGHEKNTGLENSYVRDIHDFTDNKYGEETTPQFINAIKTLRGCIGQYPEVLMPDNTTVYRGITIPIKYFADKKQPIDLKGLNPYIYKAKNKIQSWSTNFNIAATFGNHDIVNELASKIDFKEYSTPQARQILLQNMIHEDLRIPFILEYHTNPKDFIFKSKYFRLLSSSQHEDEVISIDNKPVKLMIKFNDHESVFLSVKGFMLIKYVNQALKEL